MKKGLKIIKLLEKSKFYILLKYFYKRSTIDIQLFKYHRSFSSINDYKEYLIKNSKDYYLQIFFTKNQANKERLNVLLDSLKLDLTNKAIIDFGPEAGESLDLVKSKNAAIIDFVDYNKDVCFFNELCGYKSFLMDYLKDQQRLNKLTSNKYDLILNIGALNADNINSSDMNLIFFKNFLTHLDRIKKPDGTVVICPTFSRGDEEYKTYWSRGNGYKHYCKDIELFKKSEFFKIIISFGYENTWIESFNHDPCFPFTFIKTN